MVGFTDFNKYLRPKLEIKVKRKQRRVAKRNEKERTEEGHTRRKEKKGERRRRISFSLSITKENEPEKCILSFPKGAFPAIFL